MSIYQYGTLVFIPHESELRVTSDQLRMRYDPRSAKVCPSHITITQPFAVCPSEEDLLRIEKLIEDEVKFEIEVGPVVPSPNKKLIWFDINSKESILTVREKLHLTGLFRTDLPLTSGFIPHMTISEVPRSPDEVKAIGLSLNEKFGSWRTEFDSISWIVPNQQSIFEVRKVFKLGL